MQNRHKKYEIKIYHLPFLCRRKAHQPAGNVGEVSTVVGDGGAGLLPLLGEHGPLPKATRSVTVG